MFFGENWHDASFYIKEQTQNNKFEIWVLKTTNLDPQKSMFLVFEEKPPKHFSLCFGFDSVHKMFWSKQSDNNFETS